MTIFEAILVHPEDRQTLEDLTIDPDYEELIMRKLTLRKLPCWRRELRTVSRCPRPYNEFNTDFMNLPSIVGIPSNSTFRNQAVTTRIDIFPTLPG